MNRTGMESLYKIDFRWKINDILGKADKYLFDKETANTFSRNDWEVIHEGVVMIKEEIATLPSGKKIIQLSSKRPLLDKKGHSKGIAGVTINISEFKKLSFGIGNALKKR